MSNYKIIQIFEYFFKLKNGTDKLSIPADQPFSIPPECPLSRWYQNDAKFNKVKKTHFRVPPSNQKKAISRLQKVCRQYTTFTLRHNYSF